MIFKKKSVNEEAWYKLVGKISADAPRSVPQMRLIEHSSSEFRSEDETASSSSSHEDWQLCSVWALCFLRTSRCFSSSVYSICVHSTMAHLCMNVKVSINLERRSFTFANYFFILLSRISYGHTCSIVYVGFCISSISVYHYSFD